MENFRVQICGNDWILRHPDSMIPVLKSKHRDEVIAQLPVWFKRRKEVVQVDIFDSTGTWEKQIEINPTALTNVL